VSTFAKLESLLVVEVSESFGAATLAAKMLSDAGCPVVRIEGVDGAPAHESECDRELFDLVSSGKHSVAISWSPASADVLDAMLAQARILVVDREGLLRVRALLRCDELSTRYPRLTVCAFTLFGLEGPMAAWTGGEEIVQAASGIMSITGHPGSGPTRVAGIPLTYASAMFGVTSCLADVERRKTGATTGVLDVSVYDAAVAFQSASMPAYFLTGIAPRGIGNRHTMSVPWNSFRCADGWVIICAGNHSNWVRLCEMIGRPELVADPRLATQEDRIVHIDEIEEAVSGWMADRSVEDVEALLNANAIAGGSILPLHDVVEHAQFRARGLLRTGRQSGGVFHLDREPLDVREGAWRPGAGTRAVLVDRCGVTVAQYERWLAQGAVLEAQGVAGAKTA
jgi:crotonobetainyl-CoA:carnitine CoA-transferase CaiB-like acyl-CoA transferase